MDDRVLGSCRPVFSKKISCRPVWPKGAVVQIYTPCIRRRTGLLPYVWPGGLNKIIDRMAIILTLREVEIPDLFWWIIFQKLQFLKL